jgi:hypothetical protein
MHRLGLGHDTHRLGPGATLLIGGVPIPHDRAAIGHSDADLPRKRLLRHRPVAQRYAQWRGHVDRGLARLGAPPP